MYKFLQTKSTEGVSLHMYEMSMYNNWNCVVTTSMTQFSKIMACTIDFSACWSNMLSLT